MEIVVRSEQWKPVRGWEEYYEVSDRGSIRRLSTRHVLEHVHGENGYLVVSLSRPGRIVQCRVHRLVAEAFLGVPAPGHEVRHLDGDRHNPAAVNLAWGTKAENAADMVRHGTHAEARKTHCLRGHPFDEENTHYSQRGRRCRACHRDSERERRSAAR